MPAASNRTLGYPGWLVANGVLVMTMVLILGFCWTADNEVWSWVPESALQVLLWVVLIGGPVALVLCCWWLHKIDKSIQHSRLRAVFCVMNFVGIGFGLVALLLGALVLLLRI